MSSRSTDDFSTKIVPFDDDVVEETAKDAVERDALGGLGDPCGEEDLQTSTSRKGSTLARSHNAL